MNDASVFCGKQGGKKRRSRSKAHGRTTAVVWLLAATAFLMLVAFVASYKELRLDPFTPCQVRELATLRLPIGVRAQGIDSGDVSYALRNAPEGATIDERSAEIVWRPSEAQGPGLYQMEVVASYARDASVTASQPLIIEVFESHQRPAVSEVPPLSVVSVEGKVDVSVRIEAHDLDQPATPLRFMLGQGAPSGCRIDESTGRITWKGKSEAGMIYRIPVTVAKSRLPRIRTTTFLEIHVGGASDAPMVLAGRADSNENLSKENSEFEEGSTDVARTVTVEGNAFEEAVLKLYRENALFDDDSYYDLRRAYARQFERRFEKEIKEAFGDHGEETSAWLEAHRDLKEELYLALSPEHDDVVAALRLFNELRRRFPEAIESYGNVAIAIAVTWDREQGGVYDYIGKQRRTHALLPQGRVGALENFQFLVENDDLMQGRLQWLPWEFLTHVVNHRTPINERLWALEWLAGNHSMFGNCYSKVPYDYEMLVTQSRTCRLDGYEYTLQNLLTFGGVCVQQADFSTRVGKSIGVPAAFVGGDGKWGGDGHAWVMWVEVRHVDETSIVFDLLDCGRYRGDHYYTGHLVDPQTGMRITDGDLELRLQSVGLNPERKRHAAMTMGAYPWLSERVEMSASDRIQFLREAVYLCPGTEGAWIALAKMSRDGLIDEEHVDTMDAALDRMFVWFKRAPDFTWKVFDDFVAYVDDARMREQYYERLISLYKGAGRPDLCFAALLKLVEYMIEDDDRRAEAVKLIGQAILRHPDEGQLVPGALSRIEVLCKDVDVAPEILSSMYFQLLPKIPKARGAEPSKYCIDMYNRAIKHFDDIGDDESADRVRAELAAIKASSTSE